MRDYRNIQFFLLALLQFTPHFFSWGQEIPLDLSGTWKGDLAIGSFAISVETYLLKNGDNTYVGINYQTIKAADGSITKQSAKKAIRCMLKSNILTVIEYELMEVTPNTPVGLSRGEFTVERRNGQLNLIPFNPKADGFMTLVSNTVPTAYKDYFVREEPKVAKKEEPEPPAVKTQKKIDVPKNTTAQVENTIHLPPKATPKLNDLFHTDNTQILAHNDRPESPEDPLIGYWQKPNSTAFISISPIFTNDGIEFHYNGIGISLNDTNNSSKNAVIFVWHQHSDTLFADTFQNKIPHRVFTALMKFSGDTLLLKPGSVNNITKKWSFSALYNVWLIKQGNDPFKYYQNYLPKEKTAGFWIRHLEIKNGLLNPSQEYWDIHPNSDDHGEILKASKLGNAPMLKQLDFVKYSFRQGDVGKDNFYETTYDLENLNHQIQNKTNRNNVMFYLSNGILVMYHDMKNISYFVYESTPFWTNVQNVHTMYQTETGITLPAFGIHRAECKECNGIGVLNETETNYKKEKVNVGSEYGKPIYRDISTPDSKTVTRTCNVCNGEGWVYAFDGTENPTASKQYKYQPPDSISDTHVRIQSAGTKWMLKTVNDSIICNITNRIELPCEWIIRRVPGTRYFLIKSAVNEKYLCDDNHSIKFSVDSSSSNCFWQFQSAFNEDFFRSKVINGKVWNVANNEFIFYDGNDAARIYTSTDVFAHLASSMWTFAKIGK
ncbi:MAG: hypothetical protein ABJA78_20625 [Ferruginibacter sp.]